MNRKQLVTNLLNQNIKFDDETIDLLFSYMDCTLETNEKFNLTAITNRDEFVEKMIYDSALVLSNNDLSNKKVIDVGTGAGYPGMVLRILEPKADLYLLDSTQKKIDFINVFALANKLNINPIVDRAESYSRKHTEEFDIVIARAVAPLNILLEITTPLLKVGGEFLALKGANYQEEIDQSKKALAKLNMEITNIEEFELPESKEKRVIIHIKKNKTTNKKYPRDYSEIKKQPL